VCGLVALRSVTLKLVLAEMLGHDAVCFSVGCLGFYEAANRFL
jgi:hypothetical protein